MKSVLHATLIFSLLIYCQSGIEKTANSTGGEKLTISYTGNANVVQFKMFEGLSETLNKDTNSGKLEGSIEIPNLNDAIFTYDIIVYKKDTTGKMIELPTESQLLKVNKNAVIKSKDRFLWIGKNRNGTYLENEELMGSLITKYFKSEFLAEERKITIYTPKEVNSKTPHVYFTDGSIVSYYAPFIDKLISSKTIRPIKLIGIHASASSRHKEYVQGGDDNVQFKNHESFWYKEVLPSIEKEIENWNGKRYLFGFSNGAAFGMHTGLNHPTVFEEIIAFSTADYISPMAQMMNPIQFEFHEYPKFYMGAGRYESGIFNNNIKFLETMKDKKIQVEFKEFICGHDYNVWRIELFEYLENRFAKQNSMAKP